MNDEGGAPNVNSSPEDRLERLISDLGLSLFPADVQDEIEGILAAGQALEPDARARFVDAAKRGSRHVALSHAALEVLLFNERRDRHQEAEDIADIIHINADSIRAIERGELALDAEDPASVASWALTLGVERRVLSEALRRSLATHVGASSYSGSRELRLTTAQEDFVQRVLRVFDERNDSAAAE